MHMHSERTALKWLAIPSPTTPTYPLPKAAMLLPSPCGRSSRSRVLQRWALALSRPT